MDERLTRRGRPTWRMAPRIATLFALAVTLATVGVA